MPFLLLILLTAIALSAVAAYFSIVGLAALFAGATIPVIIMGSAMELGKVVGTKWLYSNWRNPLVPTMHRIYGAVGLSVLILITALGIFGFLSRAHLEQSAPVAGIELQVSQFQQQIDQKNEENQRLQARAAQIDRTVETFLTNDRASQGLRASQQMRQERAQIQEQIDANNQAINQLNAQALPLRQQAQGAESELGPIKYFAETIGLSDPQSAVRILIGMIMFVFDLFALWLLISFTIGWNELMARRKQAPEPGPEPTPLSEDALVEWRNVADRTVIEGGAIDAESIRLNTLRTQVADEAKAFAEDTAAIRAEIEAERDDLEIKRATVDHALAEVARREHEAQQNASELQEVAGAIQNERHELEQIQQNVAEAAKLLDQREKDLIDRVELLELIFPKGATDDQAIVGMLERNPKVLEDIIEIIESAKRDQGSINMMVKKT